MPSVAPRRTRLPLHPAPGAPARVVLDLTALAQRARERRSGQRSQPAASVAQ